MATRKVNTEFTVTGEEKLRRAITEINNGAKVLKSEMNKLTAEYDGNTDSAEFLTQKYDILERQMLTQKDKVEALFGDSLLVVGISLTVTAALLFFSVIFGKRKPSDGQQGPSEARNGISMLQAFIVGCAQAVAVVPGLSRSGTTIATGLLTGVRRDVMAQFSFLMVLIPILGEQFLDLLDVFTGEAVFGAGAGSLSLLIGFVSAFLSGLFACRAMVALVRRAKLSWFALYCLVAAVLIFIIA